MSLVVITGANRGIGLELVRQYLEDGWSVYACCRNPEGAEALTQLGEKHGEKLRVARMNVLDEQQINDAANALGEEPVDLLINNAGIADNYGVGVAENKDDPDIRNYDFEKWEEILRVNTLAPARITGAFLDNIERSENGTIVMVGSLLSSVGETWQGGRYAYRTSKAALNMVMRGFGAWLEPKGIKVISVAPGWTKTDLGGDQAYNTVEQAVSGMKKVIDKVTMKETGSYWNYDGKELPF